VTSPSSGTDNERPGRANFLLPWEIVVAPARAFDRIAATPEWLIAVGIVVALLAISDYAAFPANTHVLLAMSHKFPMEKPTPTLLWEDTILDCALTVVKLMLTATALTIFAGVRDVKKMIAYPAFLSLAANAAVIAAIGSFLVNVSVLARDPASFSDLQSLNVVLPINMAFLAAPGNVEQTQFLSQFGIFTIWADIVLAFGFAKLANVRVVSALVFVFTLELIFPFFLTP